MTEFGIRIHDRATAEANIGAVCTYNTADGREYGRILCATTSVVFLDRLCKTDTGVFAPHPIPICPRSKNNVTYSRLIQLVPEQAPVPSVVEIADPVPEAAPAPIPNVVEMAEPAPLPDKDLLIADLIRKVERLERDVDVMKRAMIRAGFVRRHIRAKIADPTGT
jgi:hypothetical protein